MADAPDFIDLIIQHEGLEPYQTPFKITSEEMRNWKTIHGYKINQKAKPSKGRENFIYLEKQEELKPSVEQQFTNYVLKPKEFGLKENPTLAEAVKVFDQTGAEGKIKFLKDNGIDVNKSLLDIIGITGNALVREAMDIARGKNAK